MEVLQKVTRTFRSIDGDIYETEEACRKHEASLPRHLVWCLSRKLTAEQLREQAVWVVGHTSQTSRTEYEAPAFLREGGEYTVTDERDHFAAYVEGELSDVIQWALDKALISGSPQYFIRKLAVTRLPQP